MVLAEGGLPGHCTGPFDGRPLPGPLRAALAAAAPASGAPTAIPTVSAEPCVSATADAGVSDGWAQ